jgi:hypothetical protein
MEDKIETRNSGINHLASGSIIFVWGILLLLQQVGTIDRNANTWPFPFAAFDALLVVTGIIKLCRSRDMEMNNDMEVVGYG